ncbi:MAG: ABC transporter permease [Acidimicrobiales bacterium]
MGTYILRRLFQMVFVVVGTTVVLFGCLFVVPGDPVGTISGGGRARDPVVARELSHRYLLDRPLPVQYVHYLDRLAHGDLGTSYRLQRPVRSVIGHKAWNTLRLAGAAVAIEIVVGGALGILAAVSRHSFWDLLIGVSTALVLGLPAFVVGLVLQDLFAVRFHLLPLSGAAQGWRSYVLPSVTLALLDLAVVARLMRGAMVDALSSDFVRAARAHGLRARSVVMGHALRNSIVPVLTYGGIAFGTLLGGALVTETIFDWDGIGNAVVTAVASQDNPVIIGVVTCGVAAFVFVNLAVDLVHAALDPRVRLR